MRICMTAALFLLALASKPAFAGPNIPMGEPYYDGSFGFSIRPPAEWRVIRRREFDGQSTVLLRMFDPSVSGDDRVITVEHLVAARSITINDRFKQATAAIKMELPDGKLEVQKLRDVSGRPGAEIVVGYSMGGQSRFRMLTIAEIAPRNFLMVRQDTSSAERGAGEARYAAIVQSLKFLSNPMSDEALKKALAAGAAWIEKLDEKAIGKVLLPEQFYVYEVNGKSMGFVEIYQRTAQMKTGTKKYARQLPGFEIYEQSWMFDADKIGRRVQSQMNLSDDFLMERWKSSVVTWVGASGDRSEQFENAYEEALRDHDVLLSSQTASFSEPLQQNSPFQLPPTYLSRVLIRLLPSLLGDLSKPRTLAFTTFDHERVGLVIRLIDVKGEKRLPGQLFGPKGFLIEVREGIAAEASEVYVDEKGKLLLMKSRALTMRPSTLDELKEIFADRVEQGEAAMVRMERAYKENEARFIQRR